jgi:hypothetical protein
MPARVRAATRASKVAARELVPGRSASKFERASFTATNLWREPLRSSVLDHSPLRTPDFMPLSMSLAFQYGRTE